MITEILKKFAAFITQQTHHEHDQQIPNNPPVKETKQNSPVLASNAVLDRWNEESYLLANPDIATRIAKGQITSAFEHYVTHGFNENRPGVSPDIRTAIVEIFSDNLKFPPEKLRKRVHGDENVTGFANVGKTVTCNIYSAIKDIVPLGNNHRILDFGCGCGRIIRYFHKLSANNVFHGTDIDKEAIAWCAEELSHIGKFIQNDIHPPLPFEDDTFDFVYSISIFTHLPETMHLEWLQELRRITKPGGYLLLTTHGEQLFYDIFGNVYKEFEKEFKEKGFYYFKGEITEGLPDFYQTSFHTQDYIVNNWGKLFEIKKFITKGIANNQDLVLCRKPASP